MVAVDGHSAAGKSTFSRRLAVSVDATIVSGDDFYRVMAPRERMHLGPAQGVDDYYDWERMRDKALIPLHEGRAVHYRPYDWKRNTLVSRTVSIAPQRIVIVEGLFVSRPEFDFFNDLTVLVVSDPEIRQRRQFDRADASKAWLERWDAAERWYYTHIRPPETFDMLIDGTSCKCRKG